MVALGTVLVIMDSEFAPSAPGVCAIDERLIRVEEVDEDGLTVMGSSVTCTVSPAAAISNAVANAIGVRVPFLPITPDRVLAALNQGGGNATV